MANRWGNNGNSDRLYFWGGSKITADGDCSHEIKKPLLLGRKAMTHLDSILRSIHITLPTKVHLVRAVVFPVVMYECESWTIKKAEHRRTDVFKLWYWRRLLRVPWTAKRSNQYVLKEICPEYSLEGLIVKLKSNTLVTWWEELTHWKRPWCWERLEAGGEWNRGWDGWMASLTWWTRVWASSGSWWWAGKPGVLQSMGSQRVGHDRDGTELIGFTAVISPLLKVSSKLIQFRPCWLSLNHNRFSPERRWLSLKTTAIVHSPAVITSLFFLSVSLFLLYYICLFVLPFRFHIQVKTQYFSLSDLFQ